MMARKQFMRLRPADLKSAHPQTRWRSRLDQYAQPAPLIAMSSPTPPVRSTLRISTTILLCLLLMACAAPPVQRPDFLLHDDLFGAPVERIRAEDVFALS